MAGQPNLRASGDTIRSLYPGSVRRSSSIARSIRCQTAKLYRFFLAYPVITHTHYM